MDHQNNFLPVGLPTDTQIVPNTQILAGEQ